MRGAAVCAGLALAVAAPRVGAAPAPIPRLVTGEGRTRLFVDGRPFLILGGELANSSASSLAFARPRLAKLPAMALNTVLVPVSWELVEPEEGKFDFRLVDDLVREARRNHLRVVLLWFGSWKNGMSSYVPGWVKRDQKRFPRAEAAGGRGVEMLSPFSDANRDADAGAFAALMREVRRADERDRTVVMVQVENEVAMIGEAADRSPAALAAYRAPVPPEVLRAVPAGAGRSAGSWEEVYGKGPATEERFMAWHFARYVEAVSRAGRAAYPLPTFVNAALDRPNLLPGQNPSGGPVPHLYEIWKAGAPSIDLLAPDIYFPEFATWCERYRRPGNPLFVPEAKNGEDTAVNALYAVGQQAIGVSPFAIDATPPAVAAPLAEAYGLAAQIAPLVLADGARTAGVLLEKAAPTVKLTLGAHLLTVAHDYTFPWSSPARNDPTWPRAGAAIVALGDDDYLVAGNGVIVTFAAPPGGAGAEAVGIERVDEGRVESGKFVATRRLNGDETHQGRQLRLPMGAFGLQRVKLYRYR
jgi:beta-galactosidase GanA